MRATVQMGRAPRETTTKTSISTRMVPGARMAFARGSGVNAELDRGQAQAIDVLVEILGEFRKIIRQKSSVGDGKGKALEKQENFQIRVNNMPKSSPGTILPLPCGAAFLVGLASLADELKPLRLLRLGEGSND